MVIKRHHIIYVCSMLMEMSLAGVTFSFPRRAAELHASSNVLGALGAVWIGTYALAAYGNGAIAKRLGRGNIARGGCFLCLLASLAFAYTTNTAGLLALSVVFGIGLAGFWPSVISWLGEDAPDPNTLNSRLASFSISWNLGFLAGYAMTGQLFERSPKTAFFVPAAVFGVIILLLWYSERVAKKTPAVTPTLQPTATLPPVPKGRGFRKNAWLANFALCFCVTGVIAMFPQLATSLNISPAVHGAMLAGHRCAALFAFIALQALPFWRTRLWPLWLAQIVAAFMLAWFFWADANWMFYVAFAVTGAVSSYTYQASIFFSLQETTEKGSGGGLHEAVLGSGMASGSLAAGWVGQHYSLRSPYIFCAGMFVLFVVAQMLIVYWRRRQRIG